MRGVVSLPPKIQDRLRYKPEQIEEVRKLAEKKTDAQIVDELNDRGAKSSKGKPFTAAMIKWIRHKHRIPAPNLKLPHERTVSEVAHQFGVSRGVVYYWINRDLVPARRLGDGHPYWLAITEETSVKLQRWVKTSHRINTNAG